MARQASQQPNPDDLENRSAVWVYELKTRDFAGQIDLTEAELKALVPLVQKAFDKVVPTARHHALRVVFAVNCAYYAVDKGFWEYFSGVLGHENTAPSQTRFGRQIEESLMSFDFLDVPRDGPFRCVGPVLEQAGVTRRSILKFAETLLLCGEDGWEQMLALTFSAFVDKVETIQPGTYLGHFLKDERRIGWNFARAVARNLHQLERQILSWDALQTVPGYRPGFWNELKQFLQLERVRPQSGPRLTAPLPRLYFDASRGQIQLLFPHEWVERRVYRMDGDVIGHPVWPLLNREDFRAHYRVTILGEEGSARSVTVLGWQLDRTPASIFHPSRGYIPPDVPVPAGRCYFLAPYGTSLPPHITKLSDFEYADIHDVRYVFWEIEVTPTSGLKAFGYTEEPKGADILHWQPGAKRLAGVTETADVFVGQLPAVTVEQANLFRENRLGLFSQMGEKPEAVKISGNDETVVVTIPTHGPCRGRVWVEPLGNLRGGDAAYSRCELPFVLLPKCDIDWPRGLFAPSEAPSISVHGDAPVRFEFPDCDVTGPGTWRARPGSRLIEGALHCEPFSIPLARIIHRAEFRRESDTVQYCYDPSEFDADFLTRSKGLPHSPATLGVSDGSHRLEIQLGKDFDNSGLLRFSSLMVRDVLKNFNRPAGAFLIKGAGRWVETGTTLLNLPALKDWLFEAEATAPGPWWQYLENGLSKWLTLVRSALASHGSVTPYVAPAGLPAAVQRWANDIALMTQTFCDPLPENPFAELPPSEQEHEATKALRWVWSARVLVERGTCEESSDATALINGYPSWVPPYEPWRATMEELLRKLRSQQDLDEIVSEWAAEARPPLPLTLKSRIGKQERGRDLTEAYIRRRNKDDVGAYRFIDHVEQRTPSGLVLDLALLLKNIVCVKNDLPFEAATTNVHSKLKPYFVGLSCIAKGQAPPKTPGVKTLDPQYLPLHSEDVALLRRAIGI